MPNPSPKLDHMPPPNPAAIDAECAPENRVKPAPDFGEKYWPLPWFNETDLGCFGNILSANNEPVAQVQPLSPALEPCIVKRNEWRNHVAAKISATMNACASMRDPAAEIQALRDATAAFLRITQTTSRELFESEALVMANAAHAKLKALA